MQTLTRFGDPFTMARTRWMLGFQRFGERLCEWETCIPKNGVFPHMSHLAAIGHRCYQTLEAEGSAALSRASSPASSSFWGMAPSQSATFSPSLS